MCRFVLLFLCFRSLLSEREKYLFFSFVLSFGNTDDDSTCLLFSFFFFKKMIRRRHEELKSKDHTCHDDQENNYKKYLDLSESVYRVGASNLSCA